MCEAGSCGLTTNQRRVGRASESERLAGLDADNAFYFMTRASKSLEDRSPGILSIFGAVTIQRHRDLEMRLKIAQVMLSWVKMQVYNERIVDMEEKAHCSQKLGLIDRASCLMSASKDRGLTAPLHFHLTPSTDMHAPLTLSQHTSSV